MEEVMQTGLATLGTLISGLIIALLVQAFRKLGFSLDAEREAQLEYVVRQEVLRVEERAARMLKESGIQQRGEQKLRDVLIAVTDRIPRVDHAEAERIVHAVLPQLGLGATAYVRELGKALKTPATS